MKTRKQFVIASVMLLCSLLAGVEAKAQAYSSGGGSATDYKSTIGYLNTATGKYSLAAGYNNTAAGQSSLALGFYSKADGLNSVAIGMFTRSQALHGITIGRGYSTAKPLTNNTNGIMFGAGSNLPTLFISAKNSENRTGKVGIGNVIDPQAKLHIKGDALEDASILLASTGSNNSVIRFRSADNNITVGSDNVMKFNAPNMQFNPTRQLVVNGAFKATGNVVLSALASSTPKLLTVGANGQLATTDLTTEGDNLGNHTATQNLNMNEWKIVNGTSGAGGIFVSSNGNVGLNTELPRQMLHVEDGNILISRTSNRPAGSTNGSILFGDTVSSKHPFGRWGIEYLDQDGVKGLNFWKTYDGEGDSLNHVLFLCSEDDWRLKGNVGIGTGRPKEKLSVNGKVLAKEVIVTKDPAFWPDYVFAPGYEMMSLAELEAYVNEHHHLPDVPSAKEVEEHGISLGEMNAILLQKVEEMTLRMIEMEKRIQELEAQSDMNNP